MKFQGCVCVRHAAGDVVRNRQNFSSIFSTIRVGNVAM